MTDPAPETITEAELAEALRNAGSIADLSKGLRGLFEPGTDDLAARIFGYVAEHREPAYEPGEVYQSPGGVKFYRLREYEDGRVWLDIDADETVRHEVPGRPLRKLVPQGSPLSEHERDLIHADLGQLLDLLGLGNYARPESSHEVFLACLEEIAKLKRRTDA